MKPGLCGQGDSNSTLMGRETLLALGKTELPENQVGETSPKVLRNWVE